jgi:CHAD domain-containing protein
VAGKLKPDEAGTRGVRRIARRRIEAALEALDGHEVGDKSVHEARKELKKARATLRLIRDALGERTYKRENAAIRDAARPLSEVRDGRVLLDALDSLVKYYGAPASALRLTGFKRVLNRRRMELRKKILERPGPLRGTREELHRVRSRADKWPVGRRGWSVLGPGLKRTYSSARDALKEAQRARTDECLHEWRKQTKYFWHELQLLEPLWPGQLGELADETHKLADLLGDDHDLAVLADRALQARQAFPTDASHKAFLAFVQRCRESLQEKAFALGKRLYEEKPAAFTARLGKYWRDWHQT